MISVRFKEKYLRYFIRRRSNLEGKYLLKAISRDTKISSANVVVRPLFLTLDMYLVKGCKADLRLIIVLCS